MSLHVGSGLLPLKCEPTWHARWCKLFANAEGVCSHCTSSSQFDLTIIVNPHWTALTSSHLKAHLCHHNNVASSKQQKGHSQKTSKVTTSQTTHTAQAFEDGTDQRTNTLFQRLVRWMEICIVKWSWTNLAGSWYWSFDFRNMQDHTRIDSGSCQVVDWNPPVGQFHRVYAFSACCDRDRWRWTWSTS